MELLPCLGKGRFGYCRVQYIFNISGLKGVVVLHRLFFGANSCLLDRFLL